MIRLLKIFSNEKTLRFTQYSGRRLCSSKSDDDQSQLKFLSELNPADATSLRPESSSVVQNIDIKYTRQENVKSVVDLIESLPSNANEMTVESLVAFFDRINGNYLIPFRVTEHPKFAILRDATEILLPQLNTKEVKHMLVAILPSKAIMHDKLSNTIADAMLKRAANIPFEQILFVDFIIRKYYKKFELSKNYNILRLRLQAIFLSKVEDELDEVDDLENLMKIVAYCQNNAEIIPPKLLNRLTTSLLLSEDDEFTVMHISSILMFLANFGKLDEHVEKLLHQMFGLWNKSAATADEVQVLLKVLAAKEDTIDKEIYKHPEFIRHCVTIVSQQDNSKLLFSVQNSFNKLDFVSVELIEHLSKSFDENIRKMSIFDYIVICTACIKADYTPPNWESSILNALKTFKFGYYLTNIKDFDWIQFALNLNKLGHCDTHLFRKILNSKYLRSQKWFDQNKADKLREILDSKDALSSDSSESSSDSDSDTESEEIGTDQMPLFTDLVNIIGENKIWPNVRVSRRLIVPYILKMDFRSGDFLASLNAPSVHENSDNEHLIGVVVVPDTASGGSKRNKMKYYARELVSRIEKRGISAIVIEESKWKTLKTYEKSLVLYTKIFNMMESYQRKRLKKFGKDF